MNLYASTIDPTAIDPRAATARGSVRAVTGHLPAGQIHPRSPAPAPGAAGDLGLPMRFMAIGLGTLALLVLAYPWHIDLLRGSFYDPHLLTFVHVNTLGLIGAVIFGASYQMLP